MRLTNNYKYKLYFSDFQEFHSFRVGRRGDTPPDRIPIHGADRDHRRRQQADRFEKLQ